MTINQQATLWVMAAFYTAYFIKLAQQRRQGVQTMILGKGEKPKGEKNVELGLKALSFSMPLIEVGSLFWNPMETPNNIQWLGIGIAIGGVIFFCLAMLTMKGSWRAGIPTKKETSLVTSGIFRYSRNPAFLGFDFLYIGILLAYPNAWHACAVAASITVFHLQILNEEKFLAQAFGADYLEYREKVNRYWGRKIKEKKKWGSWIRTITLINILLLVLSLWVKMGMNKVYDKEGIKIYAAETIHPEEVEKVADKALALLHNHDIQTHGSTYIVFSETRNDFKWRNLFIDSDALAMNWWPLPYISFAPVDMSQDRQFARKEILNRRPISSVLAHELTHTYQAEQLGFFGYKLKCMTQAWKTEGMAEVVSESSSVPLEMGLELFMRDADKEEISQLDIAGEYFYFKSHLKADYLLSAKSVAEEEFWNTDYDVVALEEEIRSEIKAGNFTPKW